MRFPFLEKGIAKGEYFRTAIETERADNVQQSRTAFSP